MNKEMFISSTPRETRLAINEEGEVAEVYYEREHEYSLAGSIYKGRVTRVLPGMQSAFVDIGLERDAFLYVSDFFENSEEYDRVVSTAEEEASRAPTATAPAAPVAARPAPQAEAAAGAPAAEQEEERGEAVRNAPSPENEAPQRRGRRRRDRRRRSGGFPADKFASPNTPLTPAPYENQPAAPTQEAAPADQAEPVQQGDGAYGIAEPRVAPLAEAIEPAPPHRESAPPRPESAPPRRESAPPHRESAPPRPESAPPRRESTPPTAGHPTYPTFVLPGERLAKYTNVQEPVKTPEPAKAQGPAKAHEPMKAHAPAAEPAPPVSSSSRPPEPASSSSQNPAGKTAFGSSFNPEPPPPRLKSKAELAALESETEAAETGVVGVEKEKIQPESPWYAAAPPKKANQKTAEDIFAQPFFEPGEIEQVGKYDLKIEDTEDALNEFSQFKVSGQPAEAKTGEAREYPPTAEYELQDEGGLEPGTTEPQAAPGQPAEKEAATPEPEPSGEEPKKSRGLRAFFRSRNDPARMEARGRRRRRGGRGRSRGGEKAAPADAQASGTAAPEPAEESAPPASAGGNGHPLGNGHEPRVERGEQGPRQIGELLKEGQEILVQIAKEPIGRKGARITSHLALPGRYLVYMPTVQHIGVSRKIASDEERARLKRLILENIGELPGGFIVRTAAAGAAEDEFKADMRFLGSLWNDIRQQFEKSRAPALIYHDLGLVERTLRDQLSPEFTHIWVDSEEQYQRVLRFVSHFMPSMTQRVRLYTRSEPMFEHFRVQEEIDRALKSKVWLKSGGYIVINQTEALVAIDVNTGKYVGKSNRLEDTIVKTNVDAIREIVRQIRLRDLGGIIVIDFIDMDERRNRQKVMQAMEEAMRSDRAPFKLLSFNDFGLMALTRKRVKQSLERALGSPCPYCSGSGLVKSVTTVCNEIFSEARKMAPQIERSELVLRVNPEVAKAMKAKGASYLNDIEETTGKTVLVRSDPQVHQEQFEIS